MSALTKHKLGPFFHLSLLPPLSKIYFYVSCHVLPAFFYRDIIQEVYDIVSAKVRFARIRKCHGRGKEAIRIFREKFRGCVGRKLGYIFERKQHHGK